MWIPLRGSALQEMTLDFWAWTMSLDPHPSLHRLEFLPEFVHPGHEFVDAGFKARDVFVIWEYIVTTHRGIRIGLELRPKGHAFFYVRLCCSCFCPWNRKRENGFTFCWVHYLATATSTKWVVGPLPLCTIDAVFSNLLCMGSLCCTREEKKWVQVFSRSSVPQESYLSLPMWMYPLYALLFRYDNMFLFSAGRSKKSRVFWRTLCRVSEHMPWPVA